MLPAPCPRCVDRCISDNDFAKGMESVLDMFPIFFCTGHGKSPVHPNPEWNAETKYIPRKDRPEWSTVGVIGKLVVYDDGTLQPGDICRVGEGGIAVKSVENGYLKTESEIMYLYKFIPPSDGTYKIKVKRLSGDHEIRFYDSEFTQLYDGYFYDRSFALTEGSVYYITLTHYYSNSNVGESYLQIYKEGV